MSLVDRRSVLATAGLVAVLAGLMATFPARLALSWFAPGMIGAWGVEGTVWRGRAAEISVSGESLGALSWDAYPVRLLLLQPAWDLELRRHDGYARGRLDFSLLGNRQTLTDLDASLSLATMPRRIVPDGVAGNLRVALQRLEISRGWPTVIAGRASVADLDLPGVILTLGPFEFSFPEQSGSPAGDIRSLGGPLAVDGRIELPERHQWHFGADLAPGENPPKELVDGLAFVGEDLGNGRRRLVLSSKP
ncbi:MAG: type II secretion system protein N [Gammaproteobacteria bacterium]